MPPHHRNPLESSPIGRSNPCQSTCAFHVHNSPQVLTRLCVQAPAFNPAAFEFVPSFGAAPPAAQPEPVAAEPVKPETTWESEEAAAPAPAAPQEVPSPKKVEKVEKLAEKVKEVEISGACPVRPLLMQLVDCTVCRRIAKESACVGACESAGAECRRET